MKGRRFIPLLVVAAGLLAYHNSFTGSFIFDDVDSIRENATIRHLWPIWQPLSPPYRGGITVEGRPLINLSLAINYALGGYHVWGYHALNLTIHILAGLILLGVVRRTLLQPALRERFGVAANELALATAVLWTIHPLQTESVTYIVQRAESIMGLFYLLTLYCFIRGTESRQPRLWYGLCLIACTLGMASKEVMVSAPLMVMLYDRTFLSGSFREVWRRRWPLYLALSGTWILLGYLLIFGGSVKNAFANARAGGVDQWEYLLTEPGVILHYLRLSVWPHPLCFDYYGWPTAKTWMNILLPALAIVILLGATAWAWRKKLALGFMGAWFFLILAPSSSFIPADSPAYEHRMYLSLAAVVALGVMGLYALTGRRSAVVIAAVVIGLGFLTWQRNQDYPTEFTIWQDTVAKRPNNPRAHANLGFALEQAGMLKDAIVHYEQALRIKPDFAQAHNNLGFALLQVGKLEEAIGHFERALRLRPDYARAHYNLGLALSQAGKVNEAMRHFERVVQINPGYAEAHDNLGITLAQAGRVQEAIAQFNLALQLKPNLAEAHNELGAALIRLGKIQDAIRHWEQALRIKPGFAEVHYNLGVTLGQAGRVQEAVRHYESALQIKADYLGVQNNLAWLLATLAPTEGGDPIRAVTLAERVCKLTGERDASHLDTLAVAYASAGRFNDAIATTQKAIALARNAGQTDLVKEIEARLQLYRDGRPYRPSIDVASPHSP